MTQGITLFASSVCGLSLLVAGLFFKKQRHYKKMHVHLVESIFTLRKKQLHEMFTLFFELCSYYNFDNDSNYLVWLEDQEMSLKQLMHQLNVVSVYDGNKSLTTWFRARDNVMCELTDFCFNFLAHSYFTGNDKVHVLVAVDKCVSRIRGQENYFDFDYFEHKCNIDWLIHIDKTNTISICTDTINIIQKEIDLFKNHKDNN